MLGLCARATRQDDGSHQVNNRSTALVATLTDTNKAGHVICTKQKCKLLTCRRHTLRVTVTEPQIPSQQTPIPQKGDSTHQVTHQHCERSTVPRFHQTCIAWHHAGRDSIKGVQHTITDMQLHTAAHGLTSSSATDNAQCITILPKALVSWAQTPTPWCTGVQHSTRCKHWTDSSSHVQRRRHPVTVADTVQRGTAAAAAHACSWRGCTFTGWLTDPPGSSRMQLSFDSMAGLTMTLPSCSIIRCISCSS